MFGDWVVDKKTQIRMYTYFVAAMICEDFEWMGTSLQDTEKDLKINQKFFKEYLELFREACKLQNLSEQMSEILIEKLQEHKLKIC